MESCGFFAAAWRRLTGRMSGSVLRDFLLFCLGRKCRRSRPIWAGLGGVLFLERSFLISNNVA